MMVVTTMVVVVIDNEVYHDMQVIVLVTLVLRGDAGIVCQL